MLAQQGTQIPIQTISGKYKQNGAKGKTLPHASFGHKHKSIAGSGTNKGDITLEALALACALGAGQSMISMCFAM